MSRTLVVTNDFPTRQGGIESFVYALAERLPADEVVVYTAAMPSDREFDALLPFPVVRDTASMLLPTPAVARRTADVLRAEGCDSVLFGAAAPLGLLADRLRQAGARRVVAADPRPRDLVGEGSRRPAAPCAGSATAATC